MKTQAKIKFLDNLDTLARINNISKEIQVNNNVFKSLSDEMKDFTVLQLQYLIEFELNTIEADRKALEKLIELYPERSKNYFIKEIAKLLLGEKPTQWNILRIEKLNPFYPYM